MEPRLSHVPLEDLDDSRQAGHGEQIVTNMHQAASICNVRALGQVPNEAAGGPSEHNARVGLERGIHAMNGSMPTVAVPVLADSARPFSAEALREAADRPAILPGKNLSGAEPVYRSIVSQMEPGNSSLG